MTPSVVAERTPVAEVGQLDERQLHFEECELRLRFSRVSEVCALDVPLIMARNHDEHYTAYRIRVY